MTAMEEDVVDEDDVDGDGDEDRALANLLVVVEDLCIFVCRLL